MRGPTRAAARLRRIGHDSWERAMKRNMENIVALARSDPPPLALLDLGCDAGARTVWIAERVGAREVHGIEIAPERADLAAARGVKVKVADLDDRFPYGDATFDIVVSNQAFEHVSDTDNFIRETYRVLKPGRRAVISTENLASWHNIAPLLLGWQPFSLANISEAATAVGNPLGLHRGELGQKGGHLRVLAYRGLRELFALYGFTVEAIRGAGYYPLPASFASVDPRHAAFLTVAARRPL